MNDRPFIRHPDACNAAAANRIHGYADHDKRRSKPKSGPAVSRESGSVLHEGRRPRKTQTRRTKPNTINAISQWKPPKKRSLSCKIIPQNQTPAFVFSREYPFQPRDKMAEKTVAGPWGQDAPRFPLSICTWQKVSLYIVSLT